jgi:paraquat-inducible protein A
VDDPHPAQIVTAASRGLGLCKACHLLQPCPESHGVHCARCGAAVYIRKPYSLVLSWFFLVLAMLLLIPANMLPMMNILMFNRGDPSTIIGGVALLVHHGIYGIAAVVFIASFVVPLGKIASIIILLLSVQFRWQINTQRRTAMYRVVEFLGRWSMLDVFVVTVMVGLVHLGQTASVEPGMGIVAFGAAVILTMLSSMSFDPRLMWDATAQDA